MNSTIAEILTHLGKFYTKKLSQEQQAHYERELKRFDEGALIAAIHLLCNKEVMFPTVLIIGRYVNEVIEARHNERKRTAPIFKDIERHAQATEAGRKALAEIVETLSRPVDPNRYDSPQAREYLTRIWRLQDAAGLPSYNNPDWYKPL